MGDGAASPSNESLQARSLCGGSNEKKRNAEGTKRRRRRGDDTSGGRSAEKLCEVRCFISPTDREKLAALSSKDSTSVSSQKTDFSHFETIEENVSSLASSR